MPGHFYPLPPPFIGGRQPYAPELGNPQSGPTPEAPPVRSRALFSSILDTWRIAPPTFIGGSQAYAPRLGLVPETVAVAGQPPFTRQSLGIVQSWWVQDPITTISLSSIAPLLATADQPPPKTALFLSILEAWSPPQYALPRQVGIASILPRVDDPPRKSYAAQIAVREAWNSPPPEAQGFSDIAPLLPVAVPDSPPRASWANFGTIRQAWEIAPDRVPRTAGNLAPFIQPPVAPDNPPVTTSVRLMSIVRQHEPAQWWALPGYVHLWGTSMFPDATPPDVAAPRRRSMVIRKQEREAVISNVDRSHLIHRKDRH